jgi:hypothetical protein
MVVSRILYQEKTCGIFDFGFADHPGSKLWGTGTGRIFLSQGSIQVFQKNKYDYTQLVFSWEEFPFIFGISPKHPISGNPFIFHKRERIGATSV